MRPRSRRSSRPNLSARCRRCRRIAGIRDAVEATGARLVYLPPYSPDLNPIELAFAKLKALLRQAAERTIPTLWDRIGSLIDAFTPEECRNFLHHAGYRHA
jgi:transposase